MEESILDIVQSVQTLKSEIKSLKEKANNQLRLEKGSWETEDTEKLEKEVLGKSTLTKKVLFKKPYDTTPNVFVNLLSLSIEQPSPEHNSKYDRRVVYGITATNVTKKGFKIKVETWHYNKIHYFKVDWFAIGA